MDQIVALRDEIKQLKHEDRARYRDVYSTLIHSLTAENELPRTQFDKKPVHFKYPMKESNILDRYKVEQHRFFMSTPRRLGKGKRRKDWNANATSKLANGGRNADDNDDSVDLPRISSPPEAGSNGYFEVVRRKNAARLQQLAEIEHKNKGFYDMVDDFIRDDQKRMAGASHKSSKRDINI